MGVGNTKANSGGNMPRIGASLWREPRVMRSKMSATSNTKRHPPDANFDQKDLGVEGVKSRTSLVWISRVGLILCSLGLTVDAEGSDRQPFVNCRWNLSQHMGARPTGMSIDTVVVHATERSSLREVEAIFRSAKREVSAHFTIARDGSVVCHVPVTMAAWHAGVSRHPDGRERVNDFSVGIELLNRNDGVDPYPQKQIEKLLLLLAELSNDLPITSIVSHGIIAVPPGRKRDPFGLNVELLQQSWKNLYAGPESSDRASKAAKISWIF